jgi:hypothetical protein
VLATIQNYEMSTIIEDGEANKSIGVNMLMDWDMANENNFR